jgi:hypothetical protein
VQKGTVSVTQRTALPQKELQPVKVPGKTETLDIPFFVLTAQRVEPVSHVTVIDLFGIDFLFAGDFPQHNKCRFIVTVFPDNLQQLFFRKEKGSVISPLKIILSLFEKPDVLVVEKKQKRGHADRSKKYQH